MENTGAPAHMEGMTITSATAHLQAFDELPPAGAAQAALSAASTCEAARLADIAPELLTAIRSGQAVLVLPIWLATGMTDVFLLTQIAPRLVLALRRAEADAFRAKLRATAA